MQWRWRLQFCGRWYRSKRISCRSSTVVAVWSSVDGSGGRRKWQPQTGRNYRWSFQRLVDAFVDAARLCIGFLLAAAGTSHWIRSVCMRMPMFLTPAVAWIRCVRIREHCCCACACLLLLSSRATRSYVSTQAANRVSRASCRTRAADGPALISWLPSPDDAVYARCQTRGSGHQLAQVGRSRMRRQTWANPAPVFSPRPSSASQSQHLQRRTHHLVDDVVCVQTQFSFHSSYPDTCSKAKVLVAAD